MSGNLFTDVYELMRECMEKMLKKKFVSCGLK